MDGLHLDLIDGALTPRLILSGRQIAYKCEEYWEKKSETRLCVDFHTFLLPRFCASSIKKPDGTRPVLLKRLTESDN
jgi:hypothetical protein